MPHRRSPALPLGTTLLLTACAAPVATTAPTAPGTPITFLPHPSATAASGQPTLDPLPRASASGGASSPRATSGASTPATPSAAVAARQLDHGLVVVTRDAALTQVRALRVAAPASMSGYSREQFPHWLDASTWGWPVAPSDECTSRSAALYRDGTDVVATRRCGIRSGHWLDPYTGTWVLSRTKVDVDHVVPLAATWRGGAGSWSATRRTQYANDPLVLVTVQASANRSKGDRTPDLWKPPNRAAWCLYAKRYTAIKAKYALSVTSPEQQALVTMLGTCTR